MLSELKTKLSDEAMEFVEQAHSHVLPMFSNLSSCYLQRRFFREQFSLVVSLHINCTCVPWYTTCLEKDAAYKEEDCAGQEGVLLHPSPGL